MIDHIVKIGTIRSCLMRVKEKNSTYPTVLNYSSSLLVLGKVGVTPEGVEVPRSLVEKNMQ